MKQVEIYVVSSLDGTEQPSLFFKNDSIGKRPLLVGLHTWSADRFNQIKNMVPIAEKFGFHLLLPEFRGKNLDKNPNCKKACGSDFAKKDIKDAIDYIIEHEEVDENNIFLLGASGGGHMSLLMAGAYPEIFRAIAAFVPITDLTKWKEQNDSYAHHISACCSDNNEEMLKRSPISYIENISKANLKIFHGKYDKIVPFRHSLDLYNAIIEKHPDASVYLDIFDGGHQFDMVAAEHWIETQYKQHDKIEVTG